MDFPIQTPRQLADVLRARRKRLALTQADAGAAVGLRAKTISAMESAPERSSILTFFKLLSALELELVLRPKTPSADTPRASEW